MKRNGKTWGILVIFSLVFLEASGVTPLIDAEQYIRGNVKATFLLPEGTKHSIPGENGEWEIEIIKREGDEPEMQKDTIKIKYTPNKTTCKTICFAQTVTLTAYDENGNRVASSIDEIYTDPMYNVFHKHTQDDQIKDNQTIVVVDHLECEGDPFTNGDDTLKDSGTKGSVNPLTWADFKDTPGISIGTRDKKKNIKKVVQTFEIAAICADTGEILGSIIWKCVSTGTDRGEIELMSKKEGNPTDAFKKALRKFVKTHSKVKMSNGVGVTHWFCPETSTIIEGPHGIFSDPWGNLIPEGFKKKWLTQKEIEGPCGGTLFLRGLKELMPSYNMYTGDLKIKSEELTPAGSVGGGQYVESPLEACEAGLNNVGQCGIKFTWSGDQTKIIGGIVFTPYKTISPEDVSPFIEEKARFINDFYALKACFVPPALMQHLLDVMTEYAEPLQLSDGPVTVSIIANVGTEEAVAYTGALLPEQVASFVREAATHESVNQELVEVFQYLGLNFGLLLGSVNVPPTEFFINETGQSKVAIVVGEGAAEMDVVVAHQIAAEINAMGPPDAPAVMVMTDTDIADWIRGDTNLILVGGPVAKISRIIFVRVTGS